MKSRWMIAVVVIAAVFVVSGAVVPGVAQDQTEQRVSDLETRVAALETEVFGSPIASPAASPVMVATPVASTGTFITAESIVFRGEGSAISDNFTLQAGNYRVRVEVPPIDHDEHLSLVIQPAPGSAPGGGFAALVNDYQAAGVSGEFLLPVYTAGEFVIAGDGNRPYTVTIEL